MNIDLRKFINSGQTIAVAISGGSDSMALLHYLISNKSDFCYDVIAINVEHGIRGKESLDDTAFVKNYCDKNSIPLYCYSVNAIEKAQTDKLSVEQSARMLRYQCFFDALSKGLCDKVATAHHQSDNVESILFNLLRGTGVKGALGIESERDDKIIRPLLSVSKQEIDKYVTLNQIPFVIDKTNLDDNYTRNYLRLNVIPKIKKAFPEFEKSLARFSNILAKEHAVVTELVKKAIAVTDKCVNIHLPQPKAVLELAIIEALKLSGVEKDWESAHINSVAELADKRNGDKISLMQGLVAVREYDKIVVYKKTSSSPIHLPFSLGQFTYLNQNYSIEKVDLINDLKSGFYADLDKIPTTSIIRTKQAGDKFTKFGGGTKSLGDFMTDKKIPNRIRDTTPLLCDGNNVLAIFGYAISDIIKVDENTKNIIKFI